MRRVLLQLCFLIICFTVKSNYLRFSHLTSRDGISQSEIYSFLEDSKGFMWFGTVDGLNRYDGYTIKTFNVDHNTSHSLANNTVRSLAEDQFGRIWIGTDNGLNFYNPENEFIYQVQLDDKFINFSVWSLLVYEEFLIIGTNHGLFRMLIIDNNEDLVKSDIVAITPFSYMKENDNLVRTLIKSKIGGIWVQTSGTTSRIIFQKNKIIPIVIDDLNYGYQTSMVEDSIANVWIGSEIKGLIRYNPKTKKSLFLYEMFDSLSVFSYKISSLAIDKPGSIWLGTSDQGILNINYDYFNNSIRQIRSIHNEPTNPNGLNSNLIYSMYISSENNLWVGTIGSGVNIYNPKQKKFQHYYFQNIYENVPKSNFIRAVYMDNQRRIWAGTHNDGLYLFNRENGNFKKLGFDKQSVFYIKRYAKDIHFVCAGDGLYLVRIINNSLVILSKDQLFDNSAVFYLTEGKSGVYWCASLHGVVRFKIENNSIKVDGEFTMSTTPGLSYNNSRVLMYDEANQELLIGTEGGGLNIMKLNEKHYPEKITVYKENSDSLSISNNYIRSIIKDKNQNIWIGTYEGLNKMQFDSTRKGRTFKKYTKKDGLPNNMIELIVEDDNNHLWIGTNAGLSKFHPGDEKFINFNALDGLQSNEFSEHTVYKSSDGEIVLGGINGINTFYPDKIKLDSVKPKTTITDFYLFNKKIIPGQKVGKEILLKNSILETDSIILSPKNKNFGFRFSAMIYPNAQKIKYAYKLEGFDENWNYTGAENRIANYTNLRHGKYIFKVKSTNTDGIWEEQSKDIFIHILTPFKYTWVAIIIYFLIIILLFIYFSHYTLIRYKTKKDLLLEKDHNEKIRKLDEMRTKFFINISHDLRTPLTLISGPLNMILKEKGVNKNVKENLEIIKRNVKRLKYLVEQLLDVRKAETGKLHANLKSLDIISFTKVELSHFKFVIKNKGLKLNFTHSDKKIVTCFDPGMIAKVYFNILSNAVKFTNKGEINIHIEKINKSHNVLLQNKDYQFFIKVEISDTGIGMSKDKQARIFERFYQDQKHSTNGYGIGLSHSKELIDVHNGIIQAESKEGLGTSIEIFLPLIENVSVEESEFETSIEDIYIDSEMENELEENPVKRMTKTVLVVEDNKDMLAFIKRGLKGFYNVLLAKDGVEGLKIAKENIPDLIISDIMMPKMDGIELCERIKSNIKVSHIPLILLTAKSDDETKYEGIETGADDFIPKPFEMDYLLIRIKNLLDTREKLRVIFQKETNFEPSSITVTSIDEKFLNKLMEYIKENLSNPEFSINSLESEMGMSHSSFYRKIKSLTGQSAQEVLQTMRMKRAHQILSDNDGLRVSEVAYMVGFTDPKYFARCFKEMYGFIPSQIEKNKD